MKQAMITLAALALVSLASSVSLAKPVFIVNGKIVSQGFAEETQRKEPTTKVYKIAATEVRVSSETGNFKKSDDVDVETLKTLLK